MLMIIRVRLIALLAVIPCFFLNISDCRAQNDNLLAVNKFELPSWSAMLYRGGTAKETFGNVICGKYHSANETIYVAELAYTLDKTNIVRRIFRPLADTVQVAGNVGRRFDYGHHDTVNEANLYLVLRWTKFFGDIEFPWNNYLNTSVGFGDGFSYASHPPYADIELGKPAKDFNRFLNYLMLEVTFALPSHPNLQLVGRLHHRCTAFGTYPKNPNAGSTSVGLGIRYYF